MDTLILRLKKRNAVGELIQACLHWLDRRGVLGRLISRSLHYDSLDGLVKFMQLHEDGYDLINISMTWSATPEGHDYWSDLCSQYNDFWENTRQFYNLKKKYG